MLTPQAHPMNDDLSLSPKLGPFLCPATVMPTTRRAKKTQIARDFRIVSAPQSPIKDRSVKIVSAETISEMAAKTMLG
jgi:hypothetical protein